MEEDATVKTGLIKEPASVYHSERDLSAHGIIEIVNRSPQHYYHQYIKGEDKKETEAMRFGSALHSALLEPAIFDKLLHVQPEINRRTNAGKQEYKDWMDSLPEGAMVITAEQKQTIGEMIDALYSHPIAGEMLSGGIPEISGYFEREGLRCKIRPDYLHPKDRMVIDVKSVADASRAAFQRALVNYGWDIQSAWYTDAFKYMPNIGREAELFAFIAMEKTAPYSCAVYIADDSVIGRGHALCEKGIRIYKECLKANHWPGYQTEAENINLPYWAMWGEYDD